MRQGAVTGMFFHGRGVAEHGARRHDGGDHGAFVVGPGDVSECQAAMAGGFQDGRFVAQGFRGDAVARCGVPPVGKLMECFALVQHQGGRTGGLETVGVGGHVQVAAETDFHPLAPWPETGLLLEQQAGDFHIGGTAQFQGNAAGFRQKGRIVFHDAGGIVQIGGGFQIEGAAQRLRWAGRAGDDQTKFETAVDVEQFAAVLERPAERDRAFPEIPGSQRGRTVVGMECRGQQHADAVREIQISFGEQLERIQIRGGPPWEQPDRQALLLFVAGPVCRECCCHDWIGEDLLFDC